MLFVRCSSVPQRSRVSNWVLLASSSSLECGAAAHIKGTARACLKDPVAVGWHTRRIQRAQHKQTDSQLCGIIKNTSTRSPQSIAIAARPPTKTNRLSARVRARVVNNKLRSSSPSLPRACVNGMRALRGAIHMCVRENARENSSGVRVYNSTTSACTTTQTHAHIHACAEWHTRHDTSSN